MLDRNISDHCIIILRNKVIDWGPKPFRVLDCWHNDKSFEGVVEMCWRKMKVQGWGDFVLKEKFKGLKRTQKAWNKDHFWNVHSKYHEISRENNIHDVKEEDRCFALRDCVDAKSIGKCTRSSSK